MAAKAKISRMDMAVVPPLPDDIIHTNILPRLAVKSLVRFRSVCKLWNSLIFEADFIKDHLYFTMQNSNDENLIMNKAIYEYDESWNRVESGAIGILSLSDLSETRLCDVPRSMPVTHSIVPYTVKPIICMLGSINGLVCLYVWYVDVFILWNPATRQAMKFKSPIGQFGLHDHHVTASFFGFCWDAMENDYKVVVNYNGTWVYSGRPIGSYIYSCKSGSWSSMPNFTFSGGYITVRVPAAIINGVPYWKYEKIKIGEKTKTHIIKYDVVSKNFRMLPALDVAVEQFCFILVNIKECLSVVAYKAYKPWSSDRLVDVHCFDERCGVWNKIYTITPLNNNVLSCFKYGGKLVFFKGGTYSCYDHKRNQIIGLYNHNYKRRIRTCFSFTASLIFLKGMKPQHLVDPLLWK